MDDIKAEVAARDWSRLVAADVAISPPGDVYGYEAALWAAGVKVHAIKQFGSYQGDWWAQIEFPGGQVGWVTGEFGSCSGCDAFEAEFVCEDEQAPGYLALLRDFGREYLTNVYTLEQAIEKASECGIWDVEAEDMVRWIKERPSPAQQQEKE